MFVGFCGNELISVWLIRKCQRKRVFYFLNNFLNGEMFKILNLDFNFFPT